MAENKTVKTRGANRTGCQQPVGVSLVKALAGMRKACFKANGEVESDYKHNLAARDLVILGRLINAWRDVVGLQLASKTCPTRLFKGKLFLIVSDSQWMQTLLFLKAGIIEKLDKLFPYLKITEVIGKVGVIPPEVEKLVKDASWPDWKEEEITEKLGVKDPEIRKAMDECQQKLSARLKGLEEKGYVLCKICRANVTRSENGICAMCLFDHRSDMLMKVRTLIADTPWLTYEEVKEQHSELTVIEYESIKNELLNESMNLVKELASDLAVDYDEESASMMQIEMIRGIVLYTGETPDKIDLSKVKAKQLPVKEWEDYIKNSLFNQPNY